MIRPLRAYRSLSLLFVLFATAEAHAERTPGFPERVLQWTVLPGETCDDVSTALYGSSRHRKLLERYNAIDCAKSPLLSPGSTLIVPAEVTDIAPALLQSLAPNVKEKPPGGDWSNAATGMQLRRNHSVNTLERARADILFVDRSRVVLGAHTLVVIYGTASQSTPLSSAPTVELDSGEVQAGLLALGGKSPVVSVKSGGQVEANSRDTTVRKQKQRTTVSVFDGSAKVRSSGVTVMVPQNFGTSFNVAQKPEPPHPLPAAPEWTPDGDQGLLVIRDDFAVIREQWAPVSEAASYRVEFARDNEFRDLIAREEVPSNVTSFRAERMPVGNYFVRVRVIDKQDFLGIASTVRSVTVVAISSQKEQLGGSGESLIASPYAVLSFRAPENIQLSIDDASFDQVPSSLDLIQRPVKKLWFRSRDGKQSTIFRLQYRPVQARLSILQNDGIAHLSAQFEGVSRDELTTRVAPQLRVIREDGSIEYRGLTQSVNGSYVAPIEVGAVAPRRVEVIDARASVLASEAITVERPKPRPKPQEASTTTGLCAPFEHTRAQGASPIFAPLPCDVLVATWGGQFSKQSGEYAMFRARAKMGNFGAEASLRSSISTHGVSTDDAFWFGITHRTFASSHWSQGPALRLGLPTTSRSPLARGEVGWATAFEARDFTFISDLGFRKALREARNDATAPKYQSYIAVATLYELSTWLTVYAGADGVLLRPVTGSALGRFGGTVGAETRGPWLVAAALYASPWQDHDGLFSVQLSLGARR